MSESGPLFDGQADTALTAMLAAIERDVAAAGVDMVRERLSQVIRHPTGYYESHIDDRPHDGHTDIDDSGVIYGPWLEGVGSRNRTTRFKGYATFRRSAQALDARAQGIADRVAETYVRRMG